MFLRVSNAVDGTPMNLSVPFCAEHSSYWTHLRFPGPAGSNAIPRLDIAAMPGETSHWVEVGSRLDTLDDGEWSLKATPQNASLHSQLHYTVEVGVPTAATATPHDQFDVIAAFKVRGCPYIDKGGTDNAPLGPAAPNSCPLLLAYDANTRGTRRIRRVEEQVATVMRRVKAHQRKLPPHGQLPTANATIVSCTDCFPNRSGLSAAWNESATQFRNAFGIQVQGEDDLASPTFSGCDHAYAYRTIGDPCRSKTCWDGIYANASRCLRPTLQQHFGNPAVGRCVAIASLGDEITIPQPESVPGGPAQATAEFIPWAQRQGLHPSDIGCNAASGANSSNWTGCHYDASTANAAANPALFYWSTVWGFQWAALQMKEFTDLVKQFLPNAGVGANFESTGARHRICVPSRSVLGFS
eukprot:COSAG05_NODE_488_length_9324_cov_10.796336_4_plen_412_part_00